MDMDRRSGCGILRARAFGCGPRGFCRSDVLDECGARSIHSALAGWSGYEKSTTIKEVSLVRHVENVVIDADVASLEGIHDFRHRRQQRHESNAVGRLTEVSAAG